MKKLLMYIGSIAGVLFGVFNAYAEEACVYEIADGPYKASEESLLATAYECPEWFRDAKFGIWSHWGPQALPEKGDWYARLMYVSDGDQFEQFYFDNKDQWNAGHWKSNIGGWEKSRGEANSRYHRKRWGHQSEFGFKDVCNAWKAEKLDPDKLMALYKKAGAKYYAIIGHHHDNFDLWDSKHHEWNSVRVGPHRDIVGEFKKAAEKQGLRFAVTLHPARTDWFSTARLMSDKDGPLKGVPYDGSLTIADGIGKWWEGLDPQKLYGKPGSELRDWTPEERYDYFLRAKDLIDNYQPDLLYFDSGRVPRKEGGLNIIAHYYNSSIAANGKNEAMVTIKGARKFTTPDVERGVVSQKYPNPWQTDTCLDNWFYRGPNAKFKSTDFVVRILIDIVSKNGNLLLNIPFGGSGELDAQGMRFLEEIGPWMDVNGEGLFGTRPWVVYGEKKKAVHVKSGNHNEAKLKYDTDEFRFTCKGDTIYTFAMGWPGKEAEIKALGKNSPFISGSVKNVTLLGYGKVHFKQGNDGLMVKMPSKQMGKIAHCLKIEGLKTNKSIDMPEAFFADTVELSVPAGHGAYTFDQLAYGDLSGQDGFAGVGRIIPVDAALKNKRLIINEEGGFARVNDTSWSYPRLTGKETEASISFDVINPSYSRVAVSLSGAAGTSPEFGVKSGALMFSAVGASKDVSKKREGLDVREKLMRVRLIMNFVTDTASVFCMNLSAEETEYTAVEGMQDLPMGLKGANPLGWNTLNISMKREAQEDRPVIIDNIEVLRN